MPMVTAKLATMTGTGMVILSAALTPITEQTPVSIGLILLIAGFGIGMTTFVWRMDGKIRAHEKWMADHGDSHIKWDHDQKNVKDSLLMAQREVKAELQEANAKLENRLNSQDEMARKHGELLAVIADRMGGKRR